MRLLRISVVKSRQSDEAVQLMLLHWFLVPPLPNLGCSEQLRPQICCGCRVTQKANSLWSLW